MATGDIFDSETGDFLRKASEEEARSIVERAAPGTSVADTTTVKPDTVFTDEDEFEPLFDTPIPEEPEPEEIRDIEDKIEYNRAEDIRLKREASRSARDEQRRLFKEKQEEKRLAMVEKRSKRAVESKERKAKLKAKYTERKKGMVDRPNLKELVKKGWDKGKEYVDEKSDTIKDLESVAWEGVWTSIGSKIYSNRTNETASIVDYDIDIPFNIDLDRISSSDSKDIMRYVKVKINVDGKEKRLSGTAIKNYSIGREGTRKSLYDYIYQNIVRQRTKQKK
tara:strand:- start:24 stop:863 length:840 start_codon:yes stop_codon:yes gene_type:complete